MLLCTTIPVHADLGDADLKVKSSIGRSNFSRSYKAKCGKAQTRCNVGFRNGKLIINDQNGIYKEQLIRVDMSRTCRQKSLVLPFVTSCYGEQLDYDYILHYEDTKGQQRSALISFWPGYLRKKVSHNKGFSEALAVWRNDATPYMSKEKEKVKKQKMLATCAKEFVTYDCSWSNYLKENPQVAKWAKNNPDLANKEFIRLKLLP